jgi:hypothetical protein
MNWDFHFRFWESEITYERAEACPNEAKSTKRWRQPTRRRRSSNDFLQSFSVGAAAASEGEPRGIWFETNVGRFAPSPVRTKSGSFLTKLWVVSLQTLVVSLHRSHLEFYMSDELSTDPEPPRPATSSHAPCIHSRCEPMERNNPSWVRNDRDLGRT